MYQIKLRSAAESIFNNKLLEDWKLTRTVERFLFEKDIFQISVEYDAVYFFNPKGNSYKISNPFFITEFKEVLNKFLN